MFIKRFSDWLSEKMKIDGSDPAPPLFKEREVWWCSIGENVGCEICGKGEKFRRPVLILRKLDAYSFIGLPITTSVKTGSWYFPTTIKGEPRTILLSQPRHFDYRRLDRKFWSITISEFEGLLIAFKDLF